MGDEAYLKHQYFLKLRDAVGASDSNINVSLFEGKNIDVGALIDTAETLPVFADRRVVFIRNSGFFKDANEKFTSYMEDPAESTMFVFCEDEVDKRSKLYKTVNAKGYVCEFNILREDELLQWIGSVLKKENRKISGDTARLLLDRTGFDMNQIKAELEKLIAYTDGSDVVTAEDVEAVCSRALSDDIFKLINAASEKNRKKVFEFYSDLYALRVSPVKIIAVLGTTYLRLLRIKELRREGKPESEIAKILGMNPYVVKKYGISLKNVGRQTLYDNLTMCAEADEAFKSGLMTDWLCLETLLVKLCS